MPFKSKEQRNAYMREYMRRRRGSSTLVQTLLSRRVEGELDAMIEAARIRFRQKWREIKDREYVVNAPLL